MKYLAVKNWDHYQHYTKRTPPWIKLYNALLDDHAFLQLSDTARGQLVLIWLVASRHKNRIPNNGRFLARAIQTTSRLQLKSLIDAGFLYETDDPPASIPLAPRKHDASTPIAPRLQDARLEKEREKEREKDKNPVRAQTRAPRKYPYFPDSDFSTLFTLWRRIVGEVDGGRFKKAFAPLYPEAGARYPTDLLCSAIEAAWEEAKDRGDYAFRAFSPEVFVGRAAYWTDWVQLPAEIRAAKIGVAS